METKNLAAWQERHGVKSLLDASEQAVAEGTRGLWCPECWEQHPELLGVLSFSGSFGLCPSCMERSHAVPNGLVWRDRRIEG